MSSYNKTFWSDNESPSLDAAHLNKIENGIEGVTDEVEDARGNYQNLKQRLDNITTPTDEQVDEAVEDYLDEHPVEVNRNSIWKTSVAPTNTGTTEDPIYSFAISDLTGAADRDVQIGDMVLYSYYYYTISNITGSTTAHSETRVSIRGSKGSTGATGATGAKGDPGDDYVLTAQDKAEIAGMVDVTGKENTSNKKSSISAQSQTGDSDTNYPTVGAVRDYVEYAKGDLEDYIDDELDALDSAKADKSNTYTKSEIDAMIGNIETLLSQI